MIRYPNLKAIAAIPTEIAFTFLFLRRPKFIIAHFLLKRKINLKKRKK